MALRAGSWPPLAQPRVAIQGPALTEVGLHPLEVAKLCLRFIVTQGGDDDDLIPGSQLAVATWLTRALQAVNDAQNFFEVAPG